MQDPRINKHISFKGQPPLSEVCAPSQGAGPPAQKTPKNCFIRVNHAEYAIRICVAAPQKDVNRHSARNVLHTFSSSMSSSLETPKSFSAAKRSEMLIVVFLLFARVKSKR